MDLNDSLTQVVVDWMKSKHNTELTREEVFAFSMEQVLHFFSSFVAMGAVATDIKREVIPIRIDQIAEVLKKMTLKYYDLQKEQEGK